MKKEIISLTTFACVVLSAPAVALISSHRVRTDDCRAVVAHVPADDVAFVPGADLRGRQVAPADLGGGYDIAAPDVVNIDIRLDLAQRLGLGEDSEGGASALIAGEGVVGRVSVQGRDVYWNDSLLPLDRAAALSAACRRAFTDAGIPLPLSKPEANAD
jgi:hypothetical protein